MTTPPKSSPQSDTGCSTPVKCILVYVSWWCYSVWFWWVNHLSLSPDFQHRQINVQASSHNLQHPCWRCSPKYKYHELPHNTACPRMHSIIASVAPYRCLKTYWHFIESHPTIGAQRFSPASIPVSPPRQPTRCGKLGTGQILPNPRNGDKIIKNHRRQRWEARIDVSRCRCYEQ